ncbi:glycosyltransferase [Fusobacterium ulcerans]|uniref:glycosyltransferase n=1 Tax=Fusobacterium ulcerans TaxID=861 RepID=UPI0026DAECF7|nr:glycosyltransferase [Fusobacterium ulcerans]
MKTIVVNNPAAKTSGALTILKEFLKKTSSLKCRHRFFVIVSVEELKKYETDKLKIIVIPTQNFKERIIWDFYGLKKFLKNKDVIPDIFFSIQNTGVNLSKNIPQILYFHQALSITEIKWKFLKKEERLFWMYKNIYPIFIKMYLDRIKKIIVQTEWIKKEFSQKFNYNFKNIVVMKPNINISNISKVKIIPKEKFRIFYPATPLIYKNHEIIIKALGELKKEKKDLANDLECLFTFSEKENERIDRLIKKYDVEDVIKLVGKIPYKRVLEYYKSSDLMIFPSKLETLGLPLMEAKHFNLKILAIDLPYSREVIGNYEKSCYIKRENEWKTKILIYLNKGN